MERRKLSKSKMEFSGGKEQKSGLVSVIVKVNKPGYVPDELNLRSRIDPYMFTADTQAECIDKIKDNTAVESISVNRSLPRID